MTVSNRRIIWGFHCFLPCLQNVILHHMKNLWPQWLRTSLNSFHPLPSTPIKFSGAKPTHTRNSPLSSNDLPLDTNKHWHSFGFECRCLFELSGELFDDNVALRVWDALASQDFIIVVRSGWNEFRDVIVQPQLLRVMKDHVLEAW